MPIQRVATQKSFAVTASLMFVTMGLMNLGVSCVFCHLRHKNMSKVFHLLFMLVRVLFSLSVESTNLQTNNQMYTLPPARHLPTRWTLDHQMDTFGHLTTGWTPDHLTTRWTLHHQVDTFLPHGHLNRHNRP